VAFAEQRRSELNSGTLRRETGVLHRRIRTTLRDAKNSIRTFVRTEASRLTGGSPWTRKGAALRRVRKA